MESKIKVEGSWIMVGASQESKGGLIMPTTKDYGLVLNVGALAAEDAQNLLGKKVFFGKEYQELTTNEGKVYLMKYENILLSEGD